MINLGVIVYRPYTYTASILNLAVCLSTLLCTVLKMEPTNLKLNDSSSYLITPSPGDVSLNGMGLFKLSITYERNSRRSRQEQAIGEKIRISQIGWQLEQQQQLGN